MLPSMFAALTSATLSADALPSVCMMMPTNGRPEFVEHALKRIEMQDYPGTIKVVVVDDSTSTLQARASRTQLDVSFIRLPEQHSIGSKRNIAAAACTADVV